jgi:hypothetical protein
LADGNAVVPSRWGNGLYVRVKGGSVSGPMGVDGVCGCGHGRIGSENLGLGPGVLEIAGAVRYNGRPGSGCRYKVRASWTALAGCLGTRTEGATDG